MIKMSRPTKDEYYMEIAEVVAKRSTCVRHHVGAIIVKDNQILSTGYNGAPSGFTDCLELGCLREQQGIPSGKNHEICRAVHAEQNAIIQAALHGACTAGATLYCTHQPCILCTKMIINAKIKRVVFKNSYPDPTAIQFMKEAGLIE